MRFKKGVRFRYMDPVLLSRIDLIDLIHEETVGHESFTTSANDGKHREGSAHGRGKALDLRTRDLTEDEKVELGDELRNRLGQPFFILVEQTHIHLAVRMY